MEATLRNRWSEGVKRDSLYCAQFPTVLKISTVRNSLLCPIFLGTVGTLSTVETFDLGTVEILSTVGIFEKIIDILLLITLVLRCTLITVGYPKCYKKSAKIV